MTKLYPRLMKRFALQIHEELRTVAIEDLRARGQTTHELMTWPAVGAARITEGELAVLAASLRRVADDHGWPAPLRADELSAVDLALARRLHETVSLSPAEAGFGELWSFLTLVLVPDVAFWRASGSENVERFVCTDLTRHTFARLWWRAHYFTYGLDDAEEGWALLGQMREADLDQVMTRRTSLGSNPVVTRALASTFPMFDAIAARRPESRRDLWRQVYLSWLLRLGAWWSFETMSEDDLREEMRAIVDERMAQLDVLGAA